MPFVKPKPGRDVPIPGKDQLLPVAGREVPLSSYWARRLRDGDVVRAKPAPRKRKRKAREDAGSPAGVGDSA